MHTKWLETLQTCKSLNDLEALRVHVLGKNGELTAQLKALGTLSIEEKKEKGAKLNAIRLEFQEALNLKKQELEDQELESALKQQWQDVTLPVDSTQEGGIHPITKTIEDIETYFAHFGFITTNGPDIEEEFNNFDALNIPAHHPARQSHDTFYMLPQEDGKAKKLLRTHTSPVQVRYMLS